jgi:hypothetical protein
MSSTSTTFINSINTNYPVPGVDNDTQGFRDNYSNIKNSLAALAGEVGTLQITSVSTNETNDFSFVGKLYRPVLDSVSNRITTHLEQNTNFDVSMLDGNYQRVEISNNISIGATNWPAGNQSEITLEVYNATTTSNYTVTFNNSLGKLKKENGLTLPFSITASDSAVTIFKLSSPDAGVTVFLSKVGGPFTDV